MRPIDRFGLDLPRIRFLPPGDVNDELFFVEQERGVLADNTFSLQNIRFEAPRDLRTYHSTLRILCQAFQIDADGLNFRCESRLIEEAQRINHLGKILVPIIDDAHLMTMDALRRLRLLFEDFPKNHGPSTIPRRHNLVLVAQPGLLTKLSLTMNDNIKSRVTYSALVRKLAPDSMVDFIKAELDRVALAHSTFTDDALSLIVRSSEGVLRTARNLCVASLLESVRDRAKTVDL